MEVDNFVVPTISTDMEVNNFVGDNHDKLVLLSFFRKSWSSPPYSSSHYALHHLLLDDILHKVSSRVNGIASIAILDTDSEELRGSISRYDIEEYPSIVFLFNTLPIRLRYGAKGEGTWVGSFNDKADLIDLINVTYQRAKNGGRWLYCPLSLSFVPKFHSPYNRLSYSSSTDTHCVLHEEPWHLEEVVELFKGSRLKVSVVRPPDTNRSYLLKVISGCKMESLRSHISRRVDILRTVDHPNFVECHGMYDDAAAGQIYILFEYFTGTSLKGMKYTSEQKLAYVAYQVLKGLNYLHRREIVHRDINPSHLLQNLHNEQVKIGGFGLSTNTENPWEFSVRTRNYMSPERITNNGIIDGYAADIWSFGISMLELYGGELTSLKDASGGSKRKRKRQILHHNLPVVPLTASKELRHFISSCCHEDPKKRLTARRLLRHEFITKNVVGCM